MRPDWQAIAFSQGHSDEIAMWQHYCYANKLTIEGMADELGVCPKKISRRLQELEFRVNKRRMGWDRLCQYYGFADEQAMWRECYINRQWGSYRIGLMLDVNSTTIASRRAQLGISPHPRGGNNGIREYPTSIMSRLRHAGDKFKGMTSREIAEKLRAPISTVQNYLWRLNIPYSKRKYQKQAD